MCDLLKDIYEDQVSVHISTVPRFFEKHNNKNNFFFFMKACSYKLLNDESSLPGSNSNRINFCKQT